MAAFVRSDKAAYIIRNTVSVSYTHLRRPISVCDVEGDQLTLIYKVLGQGTELLSYKEEGEYLSLSLIHI